MWIPVCDNCKSPSVVFGKVDNNTDIWSINIQHLQDSKFHACSRHCAVHLDSLFKQQKEKGKEK